jgi:hypothetical protein
VIAAAFVLFGAAIVVIDRLAPNPSGPDSSSYATAPKGLAAYADLLRRSGRQVERRQRPLAERPLDPGRTLVVLDPRGMTHDEAEAVGEFVRAGGQLVAGGITGAGWIEDALGDAPAPRGDGADVVRALVPVPETAGVTTVEDPEESAWEETGASNLPVIGEAGEPLAVVAVRGEGRALLLASAAPLQNRALARADNAALGLSATAGRPVTFLETVHGYGQETGLAALPARVWWTLLGLLLAALLFAWSHARRIGPPEDEERELPPARAEYLDALSGALVRTRRPADVAAPLRDAARARLASRAGLPADARDEDLRKAAERFELPEDEIRALLEAPADRDAALAVGRAHARLEASR